ncbi:MAG: hypothetical protein H7039_14470 [Bryobacteraceae bacterium]|nr:hypothetical protein [Bryobacteraceae bacterium]
MLLPAAFILALPAHAATLTLVDNFNSTHLLSDVIHVGDNQNDNRFIPPSPSGITFSLSFTLTAAQLSASSITLSLDQYQADNIDVALRSFVTLNDVRAGDLSFNDLLLDLTGLNTFPVVTDSFSVKPLLQVGQNTLTIVSAFNGIDSDDLLVTNVQLSGLAEAVPEPGAAWLVVSAFGAFGLARFRRATAR